MRADAPVNNYYRIAVTSSQYIGAADDAASGASSCTLRDALGIVNAGTISGTVNGCEITSVGAPAGNIYVVNLPTGGYTYTLNGSELQINANTVYMVGADRNNTIIQANAAPNVATYRVLEVGSGVTTEIDNVTIRHGYVVEDNGGGISNSGNLTLNSCRIANNQALGTCSGACAGGAVNNYSSGSLTIINTELYTNTAGMAGGVENFGGTLGITNSTLFNNIATMWGGGGIHNGGVVTIDNTTFIGNQTENGDRGGGIHNNSGTLTITNSRFVNNRAVDSGGAIASEAWIPGDVASFTIISSTFSGNTAESGGGIQNIASGGGTAVLTVTASSFYTNTAGTGGGINSYGDITSTIFITGSTFSSNSATNGNGGGVNNEGTKLIVTGSSFYTNTAPSQGGGIYNNGGTLTVNGGRFYGNAASGNPTVCGLGGGIANEAHSAGSSATVTIVGVTFANNRAYSTYDTQCGGMGGAIRNSANTNTTATISIGASTFTNNFAGDWGGAINSNSSTGMASVTLVNSALFSNTVTNGGGGGIADGNGSLTVNNSTITGNSGGGLFQIGTSTLTIHNSIVANNVGGDCGVMGGSLASGDHNIVPDNGCNFVASTSDPHLGPLADNGGSTLTQALLPGSRAIDAGNPVYCPATDQRGVPRPIDGDGDGTPVCDIGAYEAGPGYTISGQVTKADGQSVPYVSITGAGGLSAVTDLSETYKIIGVLTGTTTLTPTLNGYTFSPVARTISAPPNATSENFTAQRTQSTFAFAMGADATGLDPALATDSHSFLITNQIYETLINVEPGGTRPVPGLAESWMASPDGLTWTLTLRPGVKFHDGTNLDAAAVVYNLERWWDSAHPYHNGSFDFFGYMFGGFKGDANCVISSISTISAYQVQIVLKTPDSPLLNTLAMPAFAIPAPPRFRPAP